MKTAVHESEDVRQELLRLYNAQSSADLLVAFLRERGFSKLDSIRELRNSLDMPLAEAKRVVHLSPVWASRREQDDEFHSRLLKAYRTVDEKRTA